MAKPYKSIIMNKGNYNGKLEIKKGEKLDLESFCSDEPLAMMPNGDCDSFKIKGENEPKKQNLLGFSKIADDIKKRYQKLFRQKGISSLSILVPHKGASKEPEYSGGMVGDAGMVVEGLYYLALKRVEVREVLKVTVEAIRVAEIRKLTSISKLQGEGEITPPLFNILDSQNIYDLRDFEKLTKDQVAEIKGIGPKAVKDIEKLLNDRGLAFKKN